MKAILRASGQFLPRLRAVAIYWAIALGLVVFASFGLKVRPSGSGELWGLGLAAQFGSNGAGVLQDAYLEMLAHVWTFVWLPFACFVGLKNLAASCDPDFERFLRFGRRSRQFIELSRLLALLASLVSFALPFVIALAWGIFFRPGMTVHLALISGACYCACMLLICTLAYFLASCGLGSEMSRMLGITAPFLLTGLSAFAEKSDLRFARFMPPGLPYSSDTFGWRQAVGCMAPVALFILVRLALSAHTRWISVPAV